MAETFHPDRPIENASEDRLGRTGLARMIAGQIMSTPANDGFVIGLLGAWGSGKTSILNLVKKEIEESDKAGVIPFNPWLFSGTEQLMGRFISTLSTEVRLRPQLGLADVGKLLDVYGGLVGPLEVVPVIGSGWGFVGKGLQAVGKFLVRRGGIQNTAERQRQQLYLKLRTSKKRLVIILDDIDRLTDVEIQEVMRLVRLVADFPNCIYLLAFDPLRVESSLSKVGGDGREYLEKILQLTFEVPPVRRSDLGKILVDGIEQVVSGRKTGPFEEELWQNIFTLGMFPLFEKMRDVRRYHNGLSWTLDMVGDEVAVVDVIALEAIRVLHPRVFALLPESVEALTSLSSDSGGSSKTVHREQLDRLIAAAGEDADAMKELITRLFPASQRHLKNFSYGFDSERKWATARRVAHERSLRFYLERSYPQDVLPNTTIRQFFDSLGKRGELERLLLGLTPQALEHVLERLIDYEEDYPLAAVPAAIVALLNQLPRLGSQVHGVFGFEPEMKLSRVVYRLVRKVGEEKDREGIVSGVLPELTTLSAKMMLISMVGHQEHTGHRLISPESALQHERTLAAEIAKSAAATLSKERDLLRLCLWVERFGGQEQLGQLRGTLRQREVLLQLLVSGLSETRSQTMGDVAVRRNKRLPWELLERLFGAEELRIAVQSIDEKEFPTPDKDAERDAIELAKRYAGGWRPKERGDDA